MTSSMRRHGLHTMCLALWMCALNLGAHAQDGALTARLDVAVGVTQRSVDAPSVDGARRLALGPAPAVALGIDSGVQHGTFCLGLGVHYRTSVLGRVRDAAAGPSANLSSTAVRSHELVAGVRAGLAFGSDPGARTLAMFLGYSVRAFASVAELRMPRFSLHGPVLRLELELPLSAASMRLRLAPEFQWLPSISSALRASSIVSGVALALGGVAALILPISEHFGLQLEYRESHAWARTYVARRFSDVERFLLLGATYVFL